MNKTKAYESLNPQKAANLCVLKSRRQGHIFDSFSAIIRRCFVKNKAAKDNVI